MCGLNRTGRHFGELEEAWLVQALVPEDGLSQVEVAMLLARHKSWVCRRLAMMEKLRAAAQDDLRLGLLSLQKSERAATVTAASMTCHGVILGRRGAHYPAIPGVSDNGDGRDAGVVASISCKFHIRTRRNGEIAPCVG
jgi:hypothetical protein